MLMKLKIDSPTIAAYVSLYIGRWLYHFAQHCVVNIALYGFFYETRRAVKFFQEKFCLWLVSYHAPPLPLQKIEQSTTRNMIVYAVVSYRRREVDWIHSKARH